ncbi:LacI family DNA-binding transcriptional regulator [Rarobacter faecitabidus]|uniref:LacI family transcriptional regulator n=1 Tax=Rarobacter faecitabidus TaxID=13243 RepID=A0A542ZA21_RARFA|nr:LacI family DNA-binding transcriptional regulator [Rarobacter faecitabidus]TQL57176.1 LacI family transcriptional regulator [Rarobacter faecitabidus]
MTNSTVLSPEADTAVEPGYLQEGRTPTLALVAKMAGVSLKTASRAINGEKHVAEATRERVLKAADEVGFRINAMASLLKRGVTTPVVSLITGDLSNPFYSMVAKGVEQQIRSHGMQLTIASSDENPAAERALVEEFVNQRVRGLLIVSTLDDHSEYAEYQARGVPLVFLDRPAVGLDADSLVLDNYAGAYSGTTHLIEHGHRRIGYLGDYPRLQTRKLRYDGYADALKQAGIEDTTRWVRDSAHDVESARLVAEEMLLDDEPPTAIFAGNNQITIGALQAIANVAPNTALVGFDDFALAELLGVTTVSHDPTDMGRRAALQVLERSAVRQEAISQELVIKTRLIPRGSGERLPIA